MVKRYHIDGPKDDRYMDENPDGFYVEHDDYLSLETQLQAWHKIFETTQLTHAKARLDAAESRQGLLREALREALEGWDHWSQNSAIGYPHNEVERIKALRKQFLGD